MTLQEELLVSPEHHHNAPPAKAFAYDQPVAERPFAAADDDGVDAQDELGGRALGPEAQREVAMSRLSRLVRGTEGIEWKTDLRALVEDLGLGHIDDQAIAQLSAAEQRLYCAQFNLRVARIVALSRQLRLDGATLPEAGPSAEIDEHGNDARLQAYADELTELRHIVDQFAWTNAVLKQGEAELAKRGAKKTLRSVYLYRKPGGELGIYEDSDVRRRDVGRAAAVAAAVQPPTAESIEAIRLGLFRSWALQDSRKLYNPADKIPLDELQKLEAHQRVLARRHDIVRREKYGDELVDTYQGWLASRELDQPRAS